MSLSASTSAEYDICYPNTSPKPATFLTVPSEPPNLTPVFRPRQVLLLFQAAEKEVPRPEVTAAVGRAARRRTRRPPARGSRLRGLTRESRPVVSRGE